MLAPPALHGGFASRIVWLVTGLFLCSCGIVCFLESELGLPPWDVLHQGIAEQLGVSFGVANLLVSVAVLVLVWRLRAEIGLGTLLNAILVGSFVIALTALDAVDALSEEPLGVRIGLIAIALVCFGVGSAFYICASMGAGPRDSLMLVTSRRLGVRLGAARTGARARRARRRLPARRHRRDRHARLCGRDRTGRRGLVLAAGANAPRGSRSSIVRGMKAKGLIAAGGEATRLGELTRVVNKHLLPVGGWPMIYYPLQLLQLAGVEEVMIVTGQGHAGQLIDLLGNGRMSQRGRPSRSSTSS